MARSFGASAGEIGREAPPADHDLRLAQRSAPAIIEVGYDMLVQRHDRTQFIAHGAREELVGE